MANTTNFNWETPDDTDLVKDGAAAIRTLGSAIDTSLVDLKGGTTGQVLSKTSNTDMDFTWVAQDDSNAIQNAIVDAKGDLISATAADTPARLAVGTDNQRLVAASGEATGLKYVSDTQNTVIDAAGDLVYGTAADTLSRLAIGTAGQVLTVNSGATAPEWKTAASGGGMTLLNAGGTALSGNTTLTISSISGSYNDLIIYVVDYYSSTDSNVGLQINGDTTAANYQQHVLRATGSTSNTYGDNASAFFDSNGYACKNADNDNFTSIYIPNYANSVSKKVIKITSGFIQTTGAKAVCFNTGYYAGTTAAITSLGFKSTGGNNWSGGTVYVYGVK